jgi:molybdopterin-guanine dinucleotide biosynthesis protein
MITGVSGTGKTTAIKQIIKKYREDKKKAYYISLKPRDTSEK